MVFVEPRFLLCRQQGEVGGTEVDGAQRERLELQERTERCRLVGHGEQCVLYPHAKLPLHVDARLVGHRHTRVQRCRFPLHPDLMWSLMHTEVSPHPMPRAMHEVESCFPQRAPRHCIEL